MPSQHNQPIIMNTMAGAVDLVDVVEFVKLLLKKNPGVIDAILTSVVEETVFGVERKQLPEKAMVISKTVLSNDNMFVGYGNASLQHAVESSYKTIEFKLEPIVNGDAESVLITQLINMVEPYPDHNKERSMEEAIEMAACEAMENFVNPTHVVRLTENRVVALDIEQFNVTVRDIDGNICIALTTERPGALKGMEHSMM